LVGAENFVGASFEQLSDKFGMESWIGKKIAIFTDASLDGVGKREHGRITEKLKKLTGEDPMSINQKYHRDWEGILRTRPIVLSNEMLHFQDASSALPGRFITIKMERFFSETEQDKMLTEKLLGERAGIFNLALTALDNLRAREWQFIQPETGAEMLEELKDYASEVRMFANARCELGSQSQTLVAKLYDSYRGWCEIHGRYATNLETFSTKLRAQFPTLKDGRPRSVDGEPNPTRLTVLRGIKLKGGGAGDV
jgi:phage/plasmid-associated DNA primase